MPQPIVRAGRPATLLICITLILAWTSALAHGQVVTRVLDDFESGGWIAGQYNTAAGAVATDGPAAPGVPQSQRSLRMTPSFSGSFGGFSVEPVTPLAVPGEMKSLTVRVRTDDPRYGLKINFTDGYGRTAINNQALAWDVPGLTDNQWHTATFKIPADWVQPIAIASFSTHNWSAKEQVRKVNLFVDQLEVQTDLTNVDPASDALKSWRPDPHPADPSKALKQPPATPMIQLALSTAAQGNVFVADPPPARLVIRNWMPDVLDAAVHYTITADTGEPITSASQPARVTDIAGIDLPLVAPRNDLYHLNVQLDIPGANKQIRTLSYARLPSPAKLTEEGKIASPYGLNIHFPAHPVLEPFQKAGIVWFREYAFHYPALVSARGNNWNYGGWPSFPRIIQAYDDAGAMVVPVLQKSITAPKVEDGKVVGPIGPSLEWTQNIANILLAFPTVHFWELSNEYDLPATNQAAERLVQWKNYQLYHEKFGQLCALLGGGTLTAVENGRAGIWPDLERACVLSGHFDQIQVVNSHHYTGVEPPEINHGNFNTGFEGSDAKPPALFFDDLRAVTRAGHADGKNRRHWLTEFGWDTLAGKVVSPHEQAVFLQRGWMLSLAAGCEKAFWFFNFDSPNPQQFFDGCGLFTADGQPKPSLVAMGGLSSILPTPKYVGMINVGDNTAGYVFEQDGKLVASLFTIQGDSGPTVHIQADQLYDYFGNPLSGQSVKLTMAPIYAVGLDRADPLFAQTAYDLDTPYMELAASGDSVKPILAVTNNRQSPLNCRIDIALPDGWKLSTAPQARQVAVGARAEIPFEFIVPSTESIGMKQVHLTIHEADRTVKQIVLQVLVEPSVVLAVGPLVGRPGDTQIAVKVGNKSRRDIAGTLHINLPDGWSTPQPALTLDALKPAEVRDLTIPLTWNARIAPDQSASVTLDAGDGAPVHRPIIPNQVQIHRAANIQLDGELSDWDAAHQLPQWMLGSTLGQPDADVYLAWSDQGLYAALRVRDSKVFVTDPRSFWSGDVLEIFLDSSDNKQPRPYRAGDHQFWIVPQPAQNRVYVGRWKNADEIPSTLYDLPGVQSASKQTDDGYVMEFLLPASLLQNFKPAPGEHIGLNLNLTVRGQRYTREVFWPRAKGPDVNTHPDAWGSMELAP